MYYTTYVIINHHLEVKYIVIQCLPSYGLYLIERSDYFFVFHKKVLPTYSILTLINFMGLSITTLYIHSQWAKGIQLKYAH